MSLLENHMQTARRSFLLAGVLAAAIAQPLAAQVLELDGQASIDKELGSSMAVTVTAPAGSTVALVTDTSPGPTTVLGQTVPIGFTANHSTLTLGTVSASGSITKTFPLPRNDSDHGHKQFYVAAVVSPLGAITWTNGANMTLIARPQLAGNPLTQFPFFEHVAAINTTSSVHFAIDPRYAFLAGQTADIYVVGTKTTAQWLQAEALGTPLVDVRGGPQTELFPAASTLITDYTFLLASPGQIAGPNETALSGDTRIGVGYDVIIDRNQNGTFENDVDLIDGFDDEEAGFYVVRDTAKGGTPAIQGLSMPSDGPIAVMEGTYPSISVSGRNNIVYYPTNIGQQVGMSPIVVIKHGGGLSEDDYAHLGYHLASYGYFVVSFPGAGISLIPDLNYLLANQSTILTGAFNDHIDADRIVLMGHSVSGGSVLRDCDILYHSLSGNSYSGAPTPVGFDFDSIKLVSSLMAVALTSSGAPYANPHNVPLHVFLATADVQAEGCMSFDAQLPLFELGSGNRYLTQMYGVGHEDMALAVVGSQNGFGPNLIGQQDTHGIMLGAVLPLIEYEVKGDIPSRDFLWRQYESFHAIGSPSFGAVSQSDIVVNIVADEANGGDSLMIDDFQGLNDPLLASSGASVTMTGGLFQDEYHEGPMRDVDELLAYVLNDLDPFNGFPYEYASGAGMTTGSRACIFSFSMPTPSHHITYNLSSHPASAVLADYEYLSFRAAQGSRHPLTAAVRADVTFEVKLVDANGASGTINIGAYGAGVEEPYQKVTLPPMAQCGHGPGVGWASQFETIRIRLDDFKNNASMLDLGSVVELKFLFGRSHGSDEGRIALDDIEFIR